jgi:uncharacterized protein YdiU (UPF0061 family)
MGGLMRKFGLLTRRDGDDKFVSEVMHALAENEVDFTNFFRRLADAQVASEADAELRALFIEPARCQALLADWRERLSQEPSDPDARRAAMNAANPAYIPRNHQIEAMIKAAVDQDDFSRMEELLAVLSRPFDDQPEFAHYAQPPKAHERVTATFCGT